MKERILQLRSRYRSDYQFKTFFFSAISVLTGIFFALFSAAIGVIYQSVWNRSISVYYMLLTIVRGILVFSQRNGRESDLNKRRNISLWTHILMIFMDVCLIAPIAYMVIGERNFKYGLIPAITMAAYTTYRITTSMIQYRLSRKHKNPLVKELRVINLQDALVAVLSLQNALIIANGSSAKAMMQLTGWTSAAIWLMIVFFTVRSFLAIKMKK